MTTTNMTLPMLRYGAALLLAVGPIAAQEREPRAVLEDVTVEARIYDIRDLAARDARKVRPGPKLKLVMPPEPVQPEPDDPDETDAQTVETVEFDDDGISREQVAAGLADVVRTFIEPPLAEGQTVQPVGAHLVLIGTPDQHRWVEAFLTRHRQGRPPTIELAADLFMVPADRLATIGLEPGTRLLEADDTERVLAALEGDGIDRMSAPRIVARAFSRTTMSSLTHTSYIRDFNVEIVDIGGEKQTIADPVIDVVRDGMILDGTAGELQDGLLAVDATLTLLVLERPIPTFETSLGAGKPVTIQLPEVRNVRARLTARVTDGGRAVLTAPAMDGKHPVLVLRVRKVDPTAAGEAIQEALRDRDEQPGAAAPVEIRKAKDGR